MTIKVNADKAICKSSSWDETTLRINGVVVKWGDPVFIDRGRENVLELEAPPGFANELRLGLSSGSLTFKASPDFETPVREPFKWKITPDDSSKSGLVELVLYSADQVAPRPLECCVMSEHLADEVKEVLVNGVPYATDYNWGFRNEPQIITLAYESDSPLKKYPLQLKGVVLTGMEDENLTVIPSGHHTWSAVADASGTYMVELTGTGFINGIASPVSRVISRQLSDEATVQIDGKDAVPGSIYFRGDKPVLTLAYKQGSPLDGYLIGLWLGRSPLVTCVPAPETFTGVHRWNVELATGSSGSFYFELAAKDFGQGNIKVEGNKLLSRNLGDDLRVLANSVEIPSGGRDFNGGVPYTIKAGWKNSGLVGTPLKLSVVPETGVGVGDFIGVPGLNQPDSSGEWKLTGAMKAGTFKLTLSTADDGATLQTATNRLIVDYTNAKLTFSWWGQDAPVPPDTVKVYTISVLYVVGIRVRLAGAPMAGIPVKIVVPEKRTFEGVTDDNGYFATEPFVYRTVGTRELTAEAFIPGNNKPVAKVLVEVVAP